MNVFDRSVGKVFGVRLDTKNAIRPETAISCLALFIEEGKEYWELAFESEGFDFELEVIRNLDFSIIEKLLENKIIIESLLIAFLRDIKTANGNENAAQELFSKRLHEIFPKELAEQLYQKGIAVFYECRDGKTEFLPTLESVSQHYAKMRKALGAQERTMSGMEKTRNIRLPGTETTIVKCPQCPETKRVGPETKHFRCKKCGLDKPYPFS